MFSICFPGAAQAQKKYSLGERVEADVLHIGMWKAGVVKEVLPFDRYRVLLDEDLGKHDPTVCLEQFMRKGGGKAAGDPGTAAAANLPNTASNANAGTQPGNGAAGSYYVGQRVMADAIQLGNNFKPGTITEILPFGRYKVQFDDEIGRFGATVILEKHMKGGGRNVPAPQNLLIAKPRPKAPQAANNLAQSGAAQPMSPHETGLGMPPSGRYECNRIGAGGFGGLAGGLEIRGSTYRGLGDEGPFAPFSLSGKSIKFSSGLKGIPDSWVIRDAAFVGNASFNKPTIKIWFTSGGGGGFNHCIDCYKSN